FVKVVPLLYVQEEVFPFNISGLFQPLAQRLDMRPIGLIEHEHPNSVGPAILGVRDDGYRKQHQHHPKNKRGFFLL
ncbi:MAG TPA: hypothetical protein VFS84_05620, partial [Candidatus Binatia bacterium]|nr:hypothetical protein [Candidatus Binatia bacterium]